MRLFRFSFLFFSLIYLSGCFEKRNTETRAALEQLVPTPSECLPMFSTLSELVQSIQAKNKRQSLEHYNQLLRSISQAVPLLGSELPERIARFPEDIQLSHQISVFMVLQACGAERFAETLEKTPVERIHQMSDWSEPMLGEGFQGRLELVIKRAIRSQSQIEKIMKAHRDAIAPVRNKLNLEWQNPASSEGYPLLLEEVRMTREFQNQLKSVSFR